MPESAFDCRCAYRGSHHASAPTRLLQHPDGEWELEYGAALAQEPDQPHNYPDTADLLADLERIECWPMSLEEWRTEAMGRLWRTTVAAAENSHCLAVPITEPYGSRWDAIQERRMIRDDAQVDGPDVSDQPWIPPHRMHHEHKNP